MIRGRLIVAAIVLAWLATPDMLCLLPGVDLTMSEHECCLVMGENCGTVPMPDIHSCCRTVDPADAASLVQSKELPKPEHHDIEFAPQLLGASRPVFEPGHAISPQHGPPEFSASNTSSILRI